MKLLIIEDGENHIADAKAWFATNQPDVELTFISELKGKLVQLLQTIAGGKKIPYDAVISDIFFPYELEGKYSNPEPIGVNVALVMQQAKIPCVLCTAGNHHGVRYQWIYALACSGATSGWLIDSQDAGDGEAPTKNWEDAYDDLVTRAIPYCSK